MTFSYAQKQKTYNCFSCGQEVFFNKNIRQKNNPNKLQALDEPFEENDQFPVLHECGKTKPSYDYQGERTSSSSPSTGAGGGSSRLTVVSKEDIDQIKNDIEYIKQLLEANIKSMDKILTTQNKEGVLFSIASNMSGQTGNPQSENPGEKVDEREEEEEPQA